MARVPVLKSRYWGLPIIRVKSLGDPNGTGYAYAWAGKVLPEVGDEMVITVDGVEWEVEVVGHHTSWEGPLRTIGGASGLSYDLKDKL